MKLMTTSDPPVTGWEPPGASLQGQCLLPSAQDIHQGPRHRELHRGRLPCGVHVLLAKGLPYIFRNPFVCELPVAAAALFLSSVLSKGRGWHVFLPIPPCPSIPGRVCR